MSYVTSPVWVVEVWCEGMIGCFGIVQFGGWSRWKGRMGWCDLVGGVGGGVGWDGGESGVVVNCLTFIIINVVKCFWWLHRYVEMGGTSIMHDPEVPLKPHGLVARRQLCGDMGVE